MKETYEVKKVVKPHDIFAVVPGSKSITNRALLFAAMSDIPCTLNNILFSDDTRVFIKALQALGYILEVDELKKTVTVQGKEGKIPCFDDSRANEIHEVYVGSAGTAARFLTAFLGLSKGRYRINASEQMKKRPMKDLLEALEEIGAVVEYEEEPYHFPFVIGAKDQLSTETTVNIDKSSQFLSALLISAPLLPDEFVINVEGTHGMSYVDMTLKMMEQFGAPVLRMSNHQIKMKSFGCYHVEEYNVEPDLSAAAYFYAAGAILGVKSQVMGVYFDSLQGDIAFLKVLEKMGCTLQEDHQGIVLTRKVAKLTGGEFDLSTFSDQALTLAAIAPFASDTVSINKISHIKYQECDRIFAIVKNLSALGVVVEETEDGVKITPSELKGATIDTYEDHRVAMSFSLPGLLVDGIIISHPECCSKTFENYFECLEEYVY